MQSPVFECRPDRNQSRGGRCRYERPGRSKDQGCRKGERGHSDVSGVPDEAVRSAFDDSMPTVLLNANHGGEEFVRSLAHVKSAEPSAATTTPAATAATGIVVDP